MICLELLTEKEVIPLNNCEHVFHSECLAEYVKARVSEMKFPVVCPQPQCKLLIDEVDIHDLLEEATYNKFQQF